MVRLFLAFLTVGLTALYVATCGPSVSAALPTAGLVDLGDINECNTMRVTFGPFTGSDGTTAIVPSTVTYRIDSRIAASGSYELLDDVALLSGTDYAASTFSKDIPAAVARLNKSTSPEEHVLTVTWTWSGGGQGRKQFKFQVYDVPYVACP